MIARSPTGRPATWCSTRCRRAAFEARRAARNGEVAIELVERVIVEAPDLSECASLVAASPGACRRVLAELAVLAESGVLDQDRMWDSTHREALKLARVLLSRDRGQARWSQRW